jgi:hypothetical protein
VIATAPWPGGLGDEVRGDGRPVYLVWLLLGDGWNPVEAPGTVPKLLDDSPAVDVLVGFALRVGPHR